MFNIGSGEMIVIFLLALLVLGPERLPKAMGQVGRAVAQMRRLSSGFQDEIRRAMDPIEAPFRPGEETLSGPMPSITDEVRVVSTAEPDGPDAPDEADGPDAPDEAPEAVTLAKGPVTDDDTAAEASVEPETQALVVDDRADEAPRSARGGVTPLRPRLDAAADDHGDGDRAAG